MTATTARTKTPAIYMRVSTGLQDTANQLPELLALARTKGFEPHQIEVYTETAGASKDRPTWRRCMAACEAGLHSHIFLWAIDRCGRSLAGNLSTLLKLDELGVEVCSVREPWLTLRSPVRDLLIAIFSWVAQAEKTRISERTKASLARIKASGSKRLGRPPVLVDTAVLIDLIDHQHLSVRAAARKLKCSAATVSRLLKAHRAAAGVAEKVKDATPVSEVAQAIEITKAA